MIRIDNAKCTGCGSCVEVCPAKAITIRNDVAVVDRGLCVHCGACINVCPAGAIREVAPARVKPAEGGEAVVSGYRRGLDFRSSSPSWPYAGRGRGGLPRHRHPGLWGGVARYAASRKAPCRTVRMGRGRGRGRGMGTGRW